MINLVLAERESRLGLPRWASTRDMPQQAHQGRTRVRPQKDGHNFSPGFIQRITCARQASTKWNRPATRKPDRSNNDNPEGYNPVRAEDVSAPSGRHVACTQLESYQA